MPKKDEATKSKRAKEKIDENPAVNEVVARRVSENFESPIEYFSIYSELCVFLETHPRSPRTVKNYIKTLRLDVDQTRTVFTHLLFDYHDRTDLASCLAEIGFYVSCLERDLEKSKSFQPEENEVPERFTRKQVMYLLQELIPEFASADNTRKAEFITKLTGYISTKSMADEFSNIHNFTDPSLLEIWREKLMKSGRGRKKRNNP